MFNLPKLKHNLKGMMMGSNCNPCPPPNKCGTSQSGGDTKGGQSSGGTKGSQGTGSDFSESVNQLLGLGTSGGAQGSGASGGAQGSGASGGAQGSGSGLTPRQDFTQAPPRGSLDYLIYMFGDGPGITGETMNGFGQRADNETMKNVQASGMANGTNNVNDWMHSWFKF